MAKQEQQTAKKSTGKGTKKQPVKKSQPTGVSEKPDEKAVAEQQTKDLQKATSIISAAIDNPPVTLEAAEQAFVQADEFREYSTLLSAIAVWQIAEKKLYQPKFPTLESYLAESRTRLHSSRSYVFEAIKIAEAYYQYQVPLHEAGFREYKDASKLRIFYKAAEVHGEEEAIKQLPKLSYREYKRWVDAGHLLEEDAGKVERKIEVTSDGIRFEGQMVVSTNRIMKIYESGEEPYLVGVRSNAERRAIGKFLKAKREEWAAKGVQ